VVEVFHGAPLHFATPSFDMADPADLAVSPDTLRKQWRSIYERVLRKLRRQERPGASAALLSASERDGQGNQCGA
jgi:hypothetical protein